MNVPSHLSLPKALLHSSRHGHTGRSNCEVLAICGLLFVLGLPTLRAADPSGLVDTLSLGNARDATTATLSLTTTAELPHPYILHTPARWQEVRENVKNYPWAKAAQDEYVQQAAKWTVPQDHPAAPQRSGRHHGTVPVPHRKRKRPDGLRHRVGAHPRPTDAEKIALSCGGFLIHQGVTAKPCAAATRVLCRRGTSSSTSPWPTIWRSIPAC